MEGQSGGALDGVACEKVVEQIDDDDDDHDNVDERNDAAAVAATWFCHNKQLLNVVVANGVVMELAIVA